MCKASQHRPYSAFRTSVCLHLRNSCNGRLPVQGPNALIKNPEAIPFCSGSVQLPSTFESLLDARASAHYCTRLYSQNIRTWTCWLCFRIQHAVTIDLMYAQVRSGSLSYPARMSPSAVQAYLNVLVQRPRSHNLGACACLP